MGLFIGSSQETHTFQQNWWPKCSVRTLLLGYGISWGLERFHLQIAGHTRRVKVPLTGFCGISQDERFLSPVCNRSHTTWESARYYAALPLFIKIPVRKICTSSYHSRHHQQLSNDTVVIRTPLNMMSEKAHRNHSHVTGNIRSLPCSLPGLAR